MTKTNEWIQRLIEGAPEGATHYHDTTYLRYDGKTWVWWSDEHTWDFVDQNSLGWAQHLGGYHGSLSDLREILTLRLRLEAVLQSEQVHVLRNDAERMRDALKRISDMDSMTYHSLESEKIVAKNAIRKSI